MAEYVVPEFPSLSFADENLLNNLGPDITRLHEHHLEVKKTWYPHELIAEAQAEAIRLPKKFSPQELLWTPAAKSSATLGYLTEEGLPYYTEAILRHVDKDHPFALWVYRWTAEEARHSIAIFGALQASGALDMKKLEDLRMAMMEKAVTPHPESFAEVIIYPSPQERATRLNHNGSARLIPKPFKAVKNTFTTTAGDENLHFDFYDELGVSAFKVDPSVMTIATARQFIKFGMPGQGIPGFLRHAFRISNAGIYGLPEQEEIFTTQIDKWGIKNLENLSSDAEFARDALMIYMENKLGPDAADVRQRRADKLSELQLV